MSMIKTEIKLFTPQEARNLLENHNPKNRPLSRVRVRQYAEEMKNRRWQLNGDSIRFDEYGNLLDGQHRLAACIEAQTVFRTMVIRGLPSEVMTTIDVGKKRTLADTLTLEGVTNAKAMSAVLLRIHRIHKGPDFVVSPNLLNYTNQMGLDLYKEFSDVAPLLEKVYANREFRLMAPSLPWVVAGLYFLGEVYPASEINLRMLETFTHCLINGETDKGIGLVSTNPVRQLRSKYNQIRQQNKDRLAQNTPDWQTLSYLFMAWNLHYKEKSVSRLQMPRDKVLPQLAGATKHYAWKNKR